MKFSIFKRVEDEYWVLEEDKKGNWELSYKLTNCYITEFIKEVEPNGLLDDSYILRWSREQEFRGNKPQIIKELNNSDIFHDRGLITKFVDKLFASLRYETTENIKGTYLNQANIPDFPIDQEKLGKAVDLYNSIIEFIPSTQKELCKAFWLVPIHYILKTSAPIGRGLIYSIVTNGKTGSCKTSLSNLHKLMFEFKYEAPKLEDVEVFDSFPSIRNKISSQGGFIILDEMDKILMEGEYFNQSIRNLIKNVIKIYLPNTANNDKQGENTNYYYLGTPIINLNSDVTLESAEKERVLFFNMEEAIELEELKTLTNKDYDLLRELGKAYYNTVKELDFTGVTKELEARRLVLKSMEEKYNINFNTILKLSIHTSENNNDVYEKLINNIQYHCDIHFNNEKGYLCYKSDLSYFDWYWKAKNCTVKINARLFHKYLSKLSNDNTMNFIKTCEGIGLGKYKAISWIGGKRVKGYRFESETDFLNSIGFKEYLNPSDE